MKRLQCAAWVVSHEAEGMPASPRQCECVPEGRIVQVVGGQGAAIPVAKTAPNGLHIYKLNTLGIHSKLGIDSRMQHTSSGNSMERRGVKLHPSES